MHVNRRLLLLLAVFCSTAAAAPPGAGLDVVDASRWPLERVTCRNGKAYAGLIRHEDDRQIELIEVGLRPGQSMYLIVRPIAISEIAKIERLDAADRQLLQQRIVAFRNRVAILAALIDSIRLEKRTNDGRVSWHYDGPWFMLDSGASEKVTREAIVRIEQTFAAYRTMLTPRRKSPRPLRIVVAGSIDQFREHLAAAGLNAGNSAFFDPRQNLIVAGGDLATFARRLEEARAHHATLRKQVAHDDAQADLLAQKLAKELENRGADPEKRRQAVNAALAQRQQQREVLLRQIRQAEQQNSEMYYRQFSRLYHEALHAYLDNYVLDPQDYDVPRWLNEGWAQIFEAGLWDVDTLRVDAPRPDLLAALADDLRGDSHLRLAELLTKPAADYVAGHQANVGQLYRASWGLAWYLTFERQLLETPQMEAFLRRDGASSQPIERFEKLVGQKLPQFEAQWREKMLELAK